MSYDLALDSDESGQPLDRSGRTRSRLVAILIAILIILLLAVTPPLIKMNRYGRRIALSMSQSLGRPVHLDNVSLGLLPVPHLTLENVVVSEDPAFGREPIIRANIVEANLRLSSLWRSMEFSRVRFVEPSVNLVRNAEGRWNLEGVLVHAAQVDTAPTAQQHRSSAPRFPYIEATGGRVNLKIGDEKKPFSLTDADFALWLPSPEQWSVRLTGTPTRTDINLSDSGILRVEGSLQRAARMARVPVSLQVSWHNAPLGEATRLLTGEDQGWRGTVQVDAAIHGSLGAGRLETDLTVDDLRRADFVPAHTLALHLHCAALAEVPSATLQNAACSLPVGATQPLRLQAESVDLAHPSQGALAVQAEETPLEWFAAWVRLFSTRFPASPAVPGSLEAHLTRATPFPLPQTAADSAEAPKGVLPGTPPDGPGGAQAGRSAGTRLRAGPGEAWLGSILLRVPLPRGALPTSSPAQPGTGSSAAASAGSLEGPEGREGPRSSSSPPVQTALAEVSPGSNGDPWTITLLPVPVRLSPSSLLNFSGSATPAGYSLRAAGQASPAVLLGLARRLPPLADGLPAVLGFPMESVQTAADTPVRLDVTCSRAWSAAVAGDQTCTRSTPETLRKPVRRARR